MQTCQRYPEGAFRASPPTTERHVLESNYGGHHVVPHLVNCEFEQLAHTLTGTKFQICGAFPLARGPGSNLLSLGMLCAFFEQ